MSLKVEEYEGHTLDTDTYTYKEPEKILTEIGVSHLLIKMVISSDHIVTSDGSVTKYDENCEEE